MADNRDQSIYAFKRQVGDESLIFIYNMTPYFYESYNIGVTELGEYVEIFNSDKDVYGGFNQYNGLPLQAQEGYCFNQKYHITIKLASFGALILKHVTKQVATDEPKDVVVQAVTTKKKTTASAKKR